MITAVEYLEEQIKTSNKDTFYDLVECIVIAKEMEKQQMADAFYAPTNLAEPKNFNEYYKQKYTDESKSNIR